MNQIKQAYSYYFVIIDNISLKDLLNTNPYLITSQLECVMGYNNMGLPTYFKQGMCDVLPDCSGILLGLYMFETCVKDFPICEDFSTFFFFKQFGETIHGSADIRYNKHYPHSLSIEKLDIETPLIFLINKDDGWGSIVKTDADYFIIRNCNRILIGSKDYKLLNDLKAN